MSKFLYSLAYTAMIIVVYVFYLHDMFGYMGFEINRDVRSNLFIIFIYSILPVTCYTSSAKISSIITSFIYTLTYVPTIVTFCLAFKGPFSELIIILTAFLIGMIILFFSNKIKTSIKFSEKNKFISIYWILAFTTISIIFFVNKFYNTMSFSSWGLQMYELRDVNTALGSDLITRYLSGWLTNIFIPALLIYGLIYKKHFLSYIALFYFILMYMILASKISILLPLIIFLTFKFLKRINIRNFFITFLKYSILICVFLLVVDYFFREHEIIQFIPSVVLMRVFGNGGYLMYWYYDFFSTHPHTYLSHVNVVESMFNIYPYGNDGLGQVIGQYYWAETTNANANFWATDGIAAFGLTGVLLISFLLSSLLVFINNITDLSKNNLYILMLLPFVASLTNTSLFSSFLTGGLFINIFIFITLIIPEKENLNI